ncbi:MAG: hypothetical protein F6K19_04475 [Cyanothece sp. SIO1E1]|nr:hypothetical protein [Cyanothece sp. SIO1E1]
MIERNIRHSSRGGCHGEITLVAEVNNVIVGLSALLGRRISAALLIVEPIQLRPEQAD